MKFGKAALNILVSFLSSRCIFKLFLNGHNSSTLNMTGLDKVILIILIIPYLMTKYISTSND